MAPLRAIFYTAMVDVRIVYVIYSAPFRYIGKTAANMLRMATVIEASLMRSVGVIVLSYNGGW